MPENVIYLLHEQEEGDLMLEVSIPSIHIRWAFGPEVGK